MSSQRTPHTLPSLPAEAALSFLKDTKATLTWSPRDLSESLNINRREADQVLSFLQAQGYAHPASAPGGGKDQWLTTPAGETVSGAKPPRFTRERVEQALADLQARIPAKQQKSPFPLPGSHRCSLRRFSSQRPLPSSSRGRWHNFGSPGSPSSAGRPH